VREAEFGLAMRELVARTGLPETEIASAAVRAKLVVLPDSWYVDAGWFALTRTKLVETVRAFHRQNPLAAGVARQELRGRMPAAVLDALLAGAKELVVEGENVRFSSHVVTL